MKVIKNVLVLLADIANGLFAVLIAGYVSGTEVVWWHFVIGVLLAMSPDLDAIPELLRRGRVSCDAEYVSDHRDMLHYPVLFVLVGVLLILFVNTFFGTMFLAATMLHFFNDFYGTGWGIPLFWPLTDRRYKFCARRAGRLKRLLKANGDWDTLPHDERRFKILVSWSRDELDSYIERFGIDDWATPYYLTTNWVSGTEYALFVVAVILAVNALLY